MKRMLIPILLLISAAFLTGCRPSGTAQPQITTAIPSKTIIPKLAQTATNTPTLTQNPPAPSVTPTPALLDLINEICPPTVSKLPQSEIATGSLVILNHGSNGLEFFDLQTGKHVPITSADEETTSYAVSPDGKWLAYKSLNLSSRKEELNIITANRKIVAALSWKSEWQNIAYWLDNQQLIIKLMPSGYESFAILVLNPFTNEEKELISDFPEIYPLESPPDWRRSGPVIYNPSLQKAVFAGINNKYVLWDVGQEQSLASLETISFLQFPTKAPVWSPDGKQVLIAAPNASLEYMNDELYSLDQSGKIIKLTEFHTTFEKVSINRYSWSPDGRYIALFFDSVPSKYPGEQLAILDLSTSDVSSYCIQGEDNLDFRKNTDGFYDDQVYTGAIWAPNGHQFILEHHTAENLSNIFLVDITGNLAFQLIGKENLQPIGWMVQQP